MLCKRSCKGDANIWHFVAVQRQQRQQKVIGEMLLTVAGVTCQQNAVTQQDEPTSGQNIQ